MILMATKKRQKLFYFIDLVYLLKTKFYHSSNLLILMLKSSEMILFVPSYLNKIFIARKIISKQDQKRIDIVRKYFKI